ncbi:MAG: hypothetical protein ABSE63_08830, partial [Thermoguttaceae bacterium]
MSAFALFAALSIQQARADEDSAQPVGSGATMADRLAAIEAQNRQILQALNAGGVGDSCCNGGACGTGGTCSAYNCYSCCDLAWIITADAIVWQRSRPNGTTLLLVNNAAQTDPLVNAADLDFNFEPGTRVSIARRFSTGCELEVNYFGIDDLEATARPGVSAIFPIPGAGPTDPVRFH